MNDPESLSPELAQLESQLKSLISPDEVSAVQTMSAETITYWINVGRQRQIAEQNQKSLDDRSVARRTFTNRLKMVSTHLASAAAAALLVFGLTFPSTTNFKPDAPVASALPNNTNQSNTQLGNTKREQAETVATSPTAVEDEFVESQHQKHWRVVSSTKVPQTEAALERMLAENQRMKRPRLTTPMRSELAPINFELLHSQNSVWSLQQKFFSEGER